MHALRYIDMPCKLLVSLLLLAPYLIYIYSMIRTHHLLLVGQ